METTGSGREHLMTILEEALRQPEADRAAWLEQACGGDTALLREAADALAWEQRMGGFLQKPALNLTNPEPGEAPGAQIGPYTLVRQLGEGGMGIVFQARQTHPIRRDVALKIVKPGMDSRQVIARFEGERQALAMMEHPHIARVIDAGATPSGRPYFVMELVDGVPITQYCDAHRLTTRQRLELFLAVCEAIQHAHQKGIIHRDIKPSNILVEERDGRVVPKVIDFGIAKATQQPLTDATVTQVGVVIGTPEYMSPEQADLAGNDIDTRSDIYSLGALLYKLLAGVTPIEISPQKGLETLRAIREDEPPPPSARVSNPAENRALRGELDWIVMKALEKDRSRRYETSAAFARDIQRHLAGEPVEAGSPSTTYVLRKFARRHRVSIAVSAAFLAILVAAAAVSIRAAIQATRAQQETQAVNDFLINDLLAANSANQQARGGNRPDPEIKVRTVLDRAAAAAGRKFASQPLAEASVRQAIGAAYASLGFDREAKPHFERALEIRRRLLGERNPDTLSSMMAAAPYLPDREHEALLRKAMEGRRRVLGPTHADTLLSINALGQFTMSQRRYQETEMLFREALEGQRLTTGEESQATLESMNDLANLYLWEGKPGQAEVLFARLRDIDYRKLGTNHPLTLLAMNNLGVSQGGQGKFAEAEAILTQTVEAQKRTMGPEHPVTLNAMDSLAMMYNLSGRYPQSEALFRTILDGYLHVQGESSYGALITMVTLGDVYLSQDKYAEAEALMRRCLPVMERRAPQSWRRFFVQSVLGRSLAGQKKFAEAEPLLISGYEGMLQRQAGVPPLNPRREREKMQRAGPWIVEMYQAWGKPEKAAEWQAKLNATQ